MEISEIRIKLMDDPNDRLQAFCSVTFDGCFVIRDLKIIQGGKRSFVAMPSRKLTDRCPRCSCKNQLRSRFCSDCGCALNPDRAGKAEDGRVKLYADIAHPINSDCREMIQQQVLAAYSEEVERAKQPGYVCMYDDFGEENYAVLDDETEAILHFSPRLGLHAPNGSEQGSASAGLADGQLHRREVVLRNDLPRREIESGSDRLAGLDSPGHHRLSGQRVAPVASELESLPLRRGNSGSGEMGDGFGAGLMEG